MADVVLNINGDPGDGTTTLARYVADHPDATIINYGTPFGDANGGGVAIMVGNSGANQRFGNFYTSDLTARFELSESSVDCRHDTFSLERVTPTIQADLSSPRFATVKAVVTVPELSSGQYADPATAHYTIKVRKVSVHKTFIVDSADLAPRDRNVYTNTFPAKTGDRIVRVFSRGSVVAKIRIPTTR
ncbi:MAG: hypothetical protein ACR2KL_08945 [Nocardioidaceae bacterium]